RQLDEEWTTEQGVGEREHRVARRVVCDRRDAGDRFLDGYSGPARRDRVVQMVRAGVPARGDEQSAARRVVGDAAEPAEAVAGSRDGLGVPGRIDGVECVMGDRVVPSVGLAEGRGKSPVRNGDRLFARPVPPDVAMVDEEERTGGFASMSAPERAMAGEYFAGHGLVPAAGHLEPLAGVVPLEARERHRAYLLQLRDQVLGLVVSRLIGLQPVRVGTVLDRNDGAY